jgi:hypothetical protein
MGFLFTFFILVNFFDKSYRQNIEKIQDKAQPYAVFGIALMPLYVGY